MMAHLHTVISGDLLDENLLHSVILSIQFVQNLQNKIKSNRDDGCADKINSSRKD